MLHLQSQEQYNTINTFIYLVRAPGLYLNTAIQSFATQLDLIGQDGNNTFANIKLISILNN